MATVDTGHIVIEPDVLGGEPHIVGHRIAVSHIAIWIVYQGATVGEIAEEFGLTKGEIHAALAYYYDHKDEIDRDLAETDHRAQEMAERFPHGWSPERDDKWGSERRPGLLNLVGLGEPAEPTDIAAHKDSYNADAYMPSRSDEK